MADQMVPRTPSPVIKASKSAFTSLTPPPTTQGLRYTEHRAQTNRNMNKSGSLPTLEEARNLTGEQCRTLVLELLPMMGEVRMQLAHTQLQLNLLSISATEAAQRAEVEHEMTRREVDVLRTNSPFLRGRPVMANDQSPFYHIQRQLEVALEAGRELEEDNQQLKSRLRQAKRVIKYLNGQKLQLSDDKDLLRERIKQNRAHTDAMRNNYPTPEIITPRARTLAKPLLARSATPAPAQNPLDALLMADQILSQDPSSMPGTPRPSQARNGHTRGVHSLSSLPTTPARSRRMSASTTGARALDLMTPSNRIIYSGPTTAAYTMPPRYTQPGPRFNPINGSTVKTKGLAREDREETISETENEAVSDDETISASQASQVASGMLKKNPGIGIDYGNGGYSWMKPAGSTVKAKSNETEDDRPRKKAKMGNGNGDIGLGIKTWGSPAR